MPKYLLVVVILLAMVAAWPLMVRSEPATEPDLGPSLEYRVLSPTDLAGSQDGLKLDELLDADAKVQREQAALNRLNQLGAEGWELVEVENDHYYFIRPTVVE